MNTRQAIQPSTTPSVLSVSPSATGRRFIAGLADGLRVFRTDNCLKAHDPDLLTGSAATIAEVFDDRYCAYVTQHKTTGLSGPNVVIFWDLVHGREVTRINFYEPVRGIRLTSNWMAVILLERIILLQYSLTVTVTHTALPSDSEKDLKQDDQRTVHGPFIVHSLIPTAQNPFALVSLQNDVLVAPTPSLGQVQFVTLKAGTSTSKRVLRAHNSSIRCLALSNDASLLATASEQGTLIRVYDTKTLDQIAEYRRGVDRAIIRSLAFSPGNRWLASTSDKGTLHIFDLRPSDLNTALQTTVRESRSQPTHRKAQSYAGHRFASTAFEKDSLSGTSGPKHSPAPSTALGPGMGSGQHGSVQEYYGLRPPPVSASPPARDAAASAMAMFKASSLAPRIFKDVRSTVSASFYTGDDPPHWQGGPAFSWTIVPNGTRRRIKNPILPLPNDPTGRPPKGLIVLLPAADEASDDDGTTLYVIGGGSDPRWEMFQLVPTAAVEGGVQTGWALLNKGFRRYLTRQFAD